MRKQLKYIIITAVIIVVLVGGLIAVNLFSGEDAPSTDNNTPGQTEATPIFDFQAEEITAVDVKNAKGSYTLTQDDDGEVRINGETELPMNSATLSAAYSALTKISSDKVLKENVDNAADYGLSDPVRVTVKAGDAEKTVLIGSETPTNEGVYCMVEGEDKLLLTNSNVNYASDFGFVDYISTDIMPALEDGETDKLSYIKISGSGRPDVLEIQPKTEDETAGAGELTPFKMTSPIQAQLNSGQLSSLLKEPLLSLRPSNAVVAHPSTEQKEQFGLNSPTFLLEYQIEGSRNTVTIGGKNADGAYYLMKDGVDVVYLVDESSISFMDVPFQDLKSSIMYLEYIDKMESVEYIRENEHYIFQIEGEGDDMSASIDGKTLNIDDFRTLYQNTIGLTLSGEAEDPGTDTYAQFVFTLKSGEKHVLSYHKIDERRLFCKLDGSGHSYVIMSDLNAVFESAAKLAV